MQTQSRALLGVSWREGGSKSAPTNSTTASQPHHRNSTTMSIATRPHPTKGRALHATKPFKAGQVIATFTPLLLLPTLSHITSVCTYCLRASSPRPCSRCRAAYYCDARCQAAAWSAGHDRECAALVANVPQSKRRRQIPTPVRALIQILLAGQDLAASVDGLEGHAAQRRKTKGWADLEMMAMGACAFSGSGSSEDVVRRAVDVICKVWSQTSTEGDADGVDTNECISQIRRRPRAGGHLFGADAGHGESFVYPECDGAVCG